MQTFPVVALVRKVTLEGEVIYTPRKIAEVEAFNARGALAKVKKDYTYKCFESILRSKHLHRLCGGLNVAARLYPS